MVQAKKLRFFIFHLMIVVRQYVDLSHCCKLLNKMKITVNMCKTNITLTREKQDQ